MAGMFPDDTDGLMNLDFLDVVNMDQVDGQQQQQQQQQQTHPQPSLHGSEPQLLGNESRFYQQENQQRQPPPPPPIAQLRMEAEMKSNNNLEELLEDDYWSGGTTGDNLAPLEQCHFSQRRLTFEQVFDLLESAEMGQLAGSISARPQASPICVETPLFFVIPQNNALMTESERISTLGDPASLIGVKYQSFSNGEVWWSERHQFTRGVVARNMSRKIRSYKQGDSDEHGFSGRWYSLLKRDNASLQVTRSNCRKFVVMDAPSLVQFWRVDPSVPTSRGKKKRKLTETTRRIPSSASSTGSGGGASSTAAAPSATASVAVPSSPGTESFVSADHSSSVSVDGSSGVAAKGKPDLIQCTYDPANPEVGRVVIKGGFSVEGDAVFHGNLSVKSLHVKGSLTVEQGINGQLVTPPEAADYAEWFEKLDHNEVIEKGDVVQLRSPQQKITLDTSGNGPIMVVSSMPSVAAGVPFGAAAANGKLCGFLGQVPVKVVGPVKCGDLLVPSGKSNGLAVVGEAFHASELVPLCTAMESCGPGEHLVLSFVRWPHTNKWEQYRAADKANLDAIERIWRKTFAHTVMHIVNAAVFLTEVYKPTFDPVILKVIFSGEFLLYLWAVSHFPDYVEFAYEAYVYLFYSSAKAFVIGFTMVNLLGFLDTSGRNHNPLSREELRGILIDMLFLSYELYSCKQNFNALRATQLAVMERSRPFIEKGIPFESTFQRRKRRIKERFYPLLGLKAPPTPSVPAKIPYQQPGCASTALSRGTRDLIDVADKIDRALGLASDNAPHSTTATSATKEKEL